MAQHAIYHSRQPHLQCRAFFPQRLHGAKVAALPRLQRITTIALCRRLLGRCVQSGPQLDVKVEWVGERIGGEGGE